MICLMIVSLKDVSKRYLPRLHPNSGIHKTSPLLVNRIISTCCMISSSSLVISIAFSLNLGSSSGIAYMSFNITEFHLHYSYQHHLKSLPLM